jgi:transcriptional regulator with XRE-family HTH domain
MALSKADKVRKAQVLAASIRMLRERMRLSQEALAERIDADPGSVSRWERGEFSPTPSKRRRLAAIARKHGWGDLCMAFEQPMYEWKSALLPERDRRWLALFELVLLNRPQPHQYFDSNIPRGEYAQLLKALHAVVRSLKRSRQKGIWMITDEQIAAWQELTGQRKVKRPARASEPALIIHYNDGRIEMYRDDKEYRTTMRRRARESRS